MEPKEANEYAKAIVSDADVMYGIYEHHRRGEDQLGGAGVAALMEFFQALPAWRRAEVYKLFAQRVDPKNWFEHEVEE